MGGRKNEETKTKQKCKPTRRLDRSTCACGVVEQPRAIQDILQDLPLDIVTHHSTKIEWMFVTEPSFVDVALLLVLKGFPACFPATMEVGDLFVVLSAVEFHGKLQFLTIAIQLHPCAGPGVHQPLGAHVVTKDMLRKEHGQVVPTGPLATRDKLWRRLSLWWWWWRWSRSRS